MWLERNGAKVKKELMKEKGYYDGIYRKNQKGFGFIKLEEQKDEIYISKENSLNALNGDRVLIEIIKQESREKSRSEEHTSELQSQLS